MKLIDELRAEVKKRKIEDPAELQPILSEKLIELLKGEPMQDLNIKSEWLTVILVRWCQRRRQDNDDRQNGAHV